MGTIQNSIHTQEGMPKGIPFIIGNEAAERFSYYGMKAILTIFMVQYLKMTESDATAWYHNFSGAVYALPLLGALVSDLFFGKYKTILVLSLVYCSGHLVLALNESRDGLMWGLALIALGSGGIKPCVSAHVGDQFGEKNKHLVSKVFSYFYFAINFGSFFSTLLIPYLLDTYSPAVAFGLPGLLMLLATFVFWLGRKEFVHVPARPKLLLQEVFSKNFLFIALRLGLVYLFISVFWALYDQTGSSWVIQSNSDLMNKTIDLGFWSFDLLPSQIQSANPVLVMMFVPLFTFILYPFLSKFFVIKPLYKIALGMFLCAISFFVISYAEGQIYQGKEVSVLWQLLAFVIITMGEVLLSLTALEYSYTQAPVSVKSIVMGLYLMSVSLGNFTTSAINSYIINPLKVDKIEAEKELYIYTKETHQSGDKVNIESDLGLYLEKEYKEGEKKEAVMGTYLLGETNENGKYILWGSDRKAIKTIKGEDFNEKSIQLDKAFSAYKLNGSGYFNFFAYLMLVISVLFIPFAILLKEKVYLQESEE